MGRWRRCASGMVWASVMTVLCSHPARAGQVRITLSGSSFSPPGVTVAQGDHVVWVWSSGTHSVTSGTDGSNNGDGLFNTQVLSSGASGQNTAFTWKVDRTGAISYYCIPHFPNMTGTIVADAPGTNSNVSDFRITEVQYTAAGDLDLIEITNLGPASGNLGRYRIAIPGDVEGIPIRDVTVASLGRVVIHANHSMPNTAGNVYMPLLAGLPDATGSVALYAPNTVAGHTVLTNASQIIDFVQYGAGGQANEATAAVAGLWALGEFVPTVHAASHSIEFCGTRTDRGAAHWAEIDPPNFGTNGACADRVGVSDFHEIRDIALHAVAPNPVSTSAAATFSLARRSWVRLEVLDVQGRVVATLADGPFDAGRHARTFGVDRRLGPPGLYFLRLDADGVRRSQRFVVLD